MTRDAYDQHAGGTYRKAAAYLNKSGEFFGLGTIDCAAEEISERIQEPRRDARYCPQELKDERQQLVDNSPLPGQSSVCGCMTAQTFGLGAARALRMLIKAHKVFQSSLPDAASSRLGAIVLAAGLAGAISLKLARDNVWQLLENAQDARAFLKRVAVLKAPWLWTTNLCWL